MRYTATTITLLAAFAGSTALAQDSTSRNSDGGNGLPGDALSPWAVGTSQLASFVVDLTPFQTSTGVPFGVAPILKSGKTSTTRFNALNAASAVSPDLRLNAPFPSSSYTLWTAAGAGINPTENNGALTSTVSPSGSATVMGLGLMDFEDVAVGNTPTFANQIYAALVAYSPSTPTRLYVTRVNAAVNNTAGALDRSQFGFGGVDAQGNIAFRADAFGSAGAATSLLVGENYFRVRAGARSTSVNVIGVNGGSNSAATDRVLNAATITHAAPTLVPAGLTGRSMVIGADFTGLMRYESAANATSTLASHRPGTLDQRGNPSYSNVLVFPGSIGTAAILTRSPGGGGRTDSMSAWGVASDGSVSGGGTGATTVTLPTSIADQCTGVSWPISQGDFRAYDSQATFRGGVGPVAIGRDAQGRMLLASLVYNGSRFGTDNPYNAIAVARVDGNNPVQWSVAAWVDPNAMIGKHLVGDNGADGAPGTGDAGENDGVVDGNDAPIGTLISMDQTPFDYAGPSISSPAFDAAGNIYFIATAALRKSAGVAIVDEYRYVLVRGVNNSAGFCYSLEVMLDSNSVFVGANSTRPYMIQQFNLADDNSISSAGLWSSSASQVAWNGQNTSGIPAADSRHLGSLVVNARIVYDVDGDGQFRDPTVDGTAPNSVDEGYNVALLVMNINNGIGRCNADFDGDGDVGTDADIEAFFRCLAGNCCQACGSADFDGDGDVGTDADIEAFFRVLAGGNC